MIHGLLPRLLLKLYALSQRAVLRDPEAIKSSHGIEAVTGLLEKVEGRDAIDLLRSQGATVGSDTRILRGLVLHNTEHNFSNLSIGNQCHLGRQIFVDLAGPVHLGNRVTVSMRTSFITHTNVGDSRCGLPTNIAGINIGDDVYIGAAVTLLPGINLGAGAIVAAGSVVTMDVAPSTMVGGVPARLLRRNAASLAETANSRKTQ